MRQHNGPLVGEEFVEVADCLHRHVGLACSIRFHSKKYIEKRGKNPTGSDINHKGAGNTFRTSIFFK